MLVYQTIIFPLTSIVWIKHLMEVNGNCWKADREHKKIDFTVTLRILIFNFIFFYI